MSALITGMDAWTAAGRGAEPLAELLARRGHAIAGAPPYGAEGLRCPQCARIDDLDRERPAEALLRAVARRALRQAGLWPPPRGLGLVVGTTSGNICGPWERWHAAQVAGRAAGEERGLGRDGPTRALARELGLQGPQATLSLACASGTAAFAMAQGWLADGLAPAVLVAGLDALSLFVHAGLNGLGALAAHCCRPFSATRDGLVLGEGAAAFLLEPAEAAQRRGVEALAQLRGVGLAADAVHLSAPHREGRGAARAMTAALADGGVQPRAVDMISAHGTGTVFNDAMEAKALQAVFGQRPLALHGVKQAIGHCLGAAGAVEAALLVQALNSGCQPPPPRDVAPELGLRLRKEPLPAPHLALSTSSAFGGSNAALVLGLAGEGTVPSRRPLRTRVTARAAVELPPGKADWAALWPAAPDRFRRMNRYVRTGLVAMARLFAQVAPDPEQGVVLASPSGCRLVDLRYHRRLLQRGAAQASRLDFVHTIPGAPAAEGAIHWNLRGPALHLVGPLEQAEREARRLLRWGRARSLVALGIEAPDEEQPAVARACLVELEESS